MEHEPKLLALEMEIRRLRDALAEIEEVATNLGFAGEELRHLAKMALSDSDVAAREMHHLTADAEDLLDEVKAALADILPQQMEHEPDHRDHLLMHRIEDCLKELAERGLHRRRAADGAT